MKAQPKPRITARSRGTFLRELAASCNVTASAAKAGHARASFYRLRDQDEQFAQQWAEALGEAVDRLEAEAYRIATEGVTERTFDADGNLVSMRTRDEPRLVQFLLAAHRPQVYSERHRLELAGSIDLRAADVEAALAKFDENMARLGDVYGPEAETDPVEQLALPAPSGEVEP